MVTRTFKYRLYRSKRNRRLHQQINAAGVIYNYAISLHKRYYRRYKKSLNVYLLMSHLAKRRNRPRYAWWRCVGSQVVQDICQRISRAYTLFFNNLKRGVKTAPPGFKKVKKYSSFTLKQAGWKLLDGNKIRIGETVYKYAKSRELSGKVQTVTVKRDRLNHLFLLFVVKMPESPALIRGHSRVCGCDFGLRTFLTLSQGEDIQSPLFFKQSLTAIKAANRAVSRKKRGSKAHARAVRDLARLHQRVANRRKDFHVKTARQLAAAFDVIAFETLNMKAMQRRWGRKVSDLGFADFLSIQKHVASKLGATVIQLNQWQSTTKPCSICGYMNHALTLNDREWVCPSCGTLLSRDKNAAINIEHSGRALSLREKRA